MSETKNNSKLASTGTKFESRANLDLDRELSSVILAPTAPTDRITIPPAPQKFAVLARKPEMLILLVVVLVLSLAFWLWLILGMK